MVDVPRQANLLLCEYASNTGNRLTIVNGGLPEMPTDGAWYLAGTVDVAVEDLASEGKLWVRDESGVEVPDVGGALTIDAGITDESATVRLYVSIELPLFRLPPHANYHLVLEVGSVRSSIPFATATPAPDATDHQGRQSGNATTSA